MRRCDRSVARRWRGPFAAQLCVLAGSLPFYAWFRPSHLLYLLGSIFCNFLLAQKISGAKEPQRKRWLQLALIMNVGSLCAFKYVNFFLHGLPLLVHRGFLLPDLAFPLGISFFTVAQIMYLVDCYERLLAPLTLFEHATFVSFFPYVISGPIAKAKRMAHQFGSFGTGFENGAEILARGCYLISSGLFKKIGVKIIFIEPPLYEPIFRSVREDMARYIQETRLIDSGDVVIDFGGPNYVAFRTTSANFDDGIHLSSEAAKQMSAALDLELNQIAFARRN